MDTSAAATTVTINGEILPSLIIGTKAPDRHHPMVVKFFFFYSFFK
jgi:hypothetical protein